MLVWEKNKRTAELMCEFYYKNYYSKKYHLPYYTRHNNGFYNKYINVFIKLAELYSLREGFELYSFIDSISSEGGELKYPYQLLSKDAWEIFERNRSQFTGEREIENPDVERARQIVYFFKDLGNRTIQSWMNDITVRNRLLNGNKSDYWVLAFSKTWLIFRDENNINLDVDFKRDYQDKIKNPQILKKIKEKLGDDFIEL